MTDSSPIVITVLPYLGQKVPNQAGPGEEGGGGKENRVSCTSYTNWHDNLRKYSTLIFFREYNPHPQHANPFFLGLFIGACQIKTLTRVGQYFALCSH